MSSLTNSLFEFKPEFESSSYDIRVPEDLPKGGTVVQIRASDIDSGIYGTLGIRFTALGGPLSGFLRLNPGNNSNHLFLMKAPLITEFFLF